jgi:hypothetical protein
VFRTIVGIGGRLPVGIDKTVQVSGNGIGALHGAKSAALSLGSAMSDASGSESDPAQLVRRLRRSLRWFQIVMLLAFAGLAGVVYWQNRSMEAALARTQRAFVVLKEAKFLPVWRGTNDLAWQFVAEWENAGNTNAEDMITRIDRWTGPGLVPGFTKTTMLSSDRPPFALGPRTTVKLPDFRLPSQAMVAAKQTQEFLVIWGSAAYRDAGPGGKRHVTRFCYEVTWIGGDPTNAGSTLDVRYDWCKEGNCTDEDCVRQGYTEKAPSMFDKGS